MGALDVQEAVSPRGRRIRNDDSVDDDPRVVAADDAPDRDLVVDEPLDSA